MITASSLIRRIVHVVPVTNTAAQFGDLDPSCIWTLGIQVHQHTCHLASTMGPWTIEAKSTDKNRQSHICTYNCMYDIVVNSNTQLFNNNDNNHNNDHDNNH